MTQKLQTGVLLNPEWANNGRTMGMHKASDTLQKTEAANMSFVTTPAHPLGNGYVIQIDLSANDESRVAVRNNVDINNVGSTRRGDYYQFLFRQDGNSKRASAARVTQAGAFEPWLTTAGKLELRETLSGATVGTGTTTIADDTWYVIDLFHRSATQVVLRCASLSGYVAGNPVTMTTEVNVATSLAGSPGQSKNIRVGETTNRNAVGQVPHFFFGNLVSGAIDGDAPPGLCRFVWLPLNGNSATYHGANYYTTHDYTAWDETPPNGDTDLQGMLGNDGTDFREASTLTNVASGLPASPIPSDADGDEIHGLMTILCMRAGTVAKGAQTTPEALLYDGTLLTNEIGATISDSTTYRYQAFAYGQPGNSPPPWTVAILDTTEVGATTTNSVSTEKLMVTAVAVMVCWSDTAETMAAFPAVPFVATKSIFVRQAVNRAANY